MRITTDPRQMGGVPRLRGLRIPVATIVALVVEGQTTDGILGSTRVVARAGESALSTRNLICRGERKRTLTDGLGGKVQRLAHVIGFKIRI